ncbi:hypothetical protein F5H01DRAFT_380862 [Linnemannia elongata]|nr:hypothetical protein F5H01DRAFT_380862 [Linnemannia elongata]
MTTNAASPPKRKRRTKVEIVNGEAAKLMAVFNVLSKEKLSISDFLCATFTSPQELIKTKVGQFYATNGPARILRIWGGDLESTDNDKSLAEAAIELVGERVQADLRNTANDKKLRHPANNISYKTIKTFSLDRLRHSLKQSAPNIILLLETMIPREKPAPGSVAGWKPKDMQRKASVQRDRSSSKRAKTALIADDQLPSTGAGMTLIEEDQLPSTRARTPPDMEMESLSLPYPKFGKTVFTHDLPTTLPRGPDSGSETDSDLEPAMEMLHLRSDLALSLDQMMAHDFEWEDELDPHPEADPRCFIVVVASILAFMKSQQTNYLQMMIGAHLRGQACPKRLIKLLSMIGLSMSYSTTTSCLKSLARDNLLRMHRAGGKHTMYFLYDNINRRRQQHHQRSNKRNRMESETSGTLVIGEGLGEELSLETPRDPPCLGDIMLKKNDTSYFRHIYRSHVLNAIRAYRTLNDNDLKMFDIPPLNLLPIKRTKAYELAIMDIDQATIEGNKQVIEQMRTVLGKSKGSFKHLKMILAGDQLTISRILSLQHRSIGELTYFDQMQWAIPVLQLFHMQMILSAAILNTHYGHVSAPGSLAFYISTLGRKKLNRDKPCYRTNDEFLRIVFRAMVGQLWQHMEVPISGADLASDDMVVNELNHVVDSSLNNSTALSRTNSITNTNALLFIKDMAVYIEFCTAIKLGDIGRVELILKRLTIMFQSGKNKNYGHELLRLNFNMQHKWSEARKLAIFSSMLMNTTGLPNRWIPSDLYQEHNNLLIKQTHATVGNNKSAATYITPLIRMFRVIDNILGREFRLPANSKYHRITKMDEDIQIVMRSLKESNILTTTRHPSQHDAHPFAQIPVVDMMTTGCNKLTNGGYKRFRSRLEDEGRGEFAEDDLLEDLLDGLEDETNEAEEYINAVFG